MSKINWNTEEWLTWKLNPDSDPEEHTIIVTGDCEDEVTSFILNPAHAPAIAAVPRMIRMLAGILEESPSKDIADLLREVGWENDQDLTEQQEELTLRERELTEAIEDLCLGSLTSVVVEDAVNSLRDNWEDHNKP